MLTPVQKKQHDAISRYRQAAAVLEKHNEAPNVATGFRNFADQMERYPEVESAQQAYNRLTLLMKEAAEELEQSYPPGFVRASATHEELIQITAKETAYEVLVKARNALGLHEDRVYGEMDILADGVFADHPLTTDQEAPKSPTQGNQPKRMWPRI